MHRSTLVIMAVVLLCGADVPEPAPMFTVEETPTSLTIRSSTPGTFVVTAKPGPHPGELQLAVDKDDDGTLEFESRVGSAFNNGLASSSRNSCKARGFVPEFEIIRLVPPPPKNVWKRDRKRHEWMEVNPSVLIEHYDDGNVHIVLDANRDGVPEVDATTDFVLDEPARHEFCVEHHPTRPGLPRPR